MPPQPTRLPAPAPVAPARTPAPAPASVTARAGTPAAPARLPQAGPPAVRLGPTAPAAGALLASSSPGEPLPEPIQNALTLKLGADLTQVRVHTDPAAAAAAANVSARAFTLGNHIYLGRGEQVTDLELIAHETAHILQQAGAPRVQRLGPGGSDAYEQEAQRASAAVTRGESFTVREQTGGPRLQRLGLSDILDGLAELAANLPGFTLLTVIIGRNPINMRPVERNFINLLRGFMGLIPGGEILFQVLNRYGVVERIGNWVSDQVNSLGLTYDYLRGRFTAFIDSLSWRDIFRLGDVWQRARDIFTEPVNRIRNFISRLISQAITWLKETFMQPLSEFCRQIPGYTLVTVLLGRDPFTNAPVARTALNVVRAFAEFIPGGTEKVNQLVESRALQRAYEWFIQETQARNLTWARVTGTFATAWNSLRLEDILHPIDTLRRIVNIFRPLMGDLISFAGAALMKLLELIFEAAMGAGGARILAILQRARATFLIIIRNPVGFLRNLLGAVGQGVRQFMGNILAHLRDGVIAWLTGPVARAGIQMPERWDLRGIIWFVLQILGLTWERVRQKLVRLLGERVVAMLEAGFQLLQEIREKGLVQALRDRVTEFFGQLRDAALGSIRSFIQQRLVMAGITQLLSLLNPVGAVIQAIIKTYTTIQFFIQRINQILDLVESIVNSISAIAAGAIGAAAGLVERTMARTIPIILDFLARFIGLGDIGGQVQRTIRSLQARVDQMLDRAVDWIRNMARNLLSRALGGDPNATPQVRLERGLNEGRAAVNRFAGRRVGAVVLRPLLAAIRARHQLRSLEVVPRGNRWAVRGAVNPEGESPPTDAQVDSAAGAATGDFGSPTNPYLIKWHKPRISSYPVIHLVVNIESGVERDVTPTERVEISYPVDNDAAKARLRPIQGRINSIKRRIANQKTVSGVSRFSSPAEPAAREGYRQEYERTLTQTLERTQAELEEAETKLQEFIGMTPEQQKQEARAGRGKGKREEAVKDIERAIREIQRLRELPQLERELVSLQAEEISVRDELRSLRIYDVRRDTIGVTPDNQTSETLRALGPRIRRPSTPEHTRFRKVLEAAGFVWGSHSADHVVEATLSGPDNFTNLWPLVENIVPNQVINPETGKEINVGLENAGTTGKPYNDAIFLGKWFKIVGFKV